MCTMEWKEVNPEQNKNLVEESYDKKQSDIRDA